MDDDGNETLTPVHFFQDDGSITIGIGLNYPKKCNVALSKKRNDKYMNHFRLSNDSIVASSVTGDEGQTMKLKLRNKFGLPF